MTWFITGLRHEAIRLAKTHSKLCKHELLILNNPISQDAEDEDIELLDTLPAPDDIYAEVDDAISLQEALELLTPNQRKVIKAVILNGFTEQDVSKQMKISQSSVHKLKMRALNRLRKYYVMDKLAT